MVLHNNSPRALITGGTGSVGRALVEAFSREQYQVEFQFHEDQSSADLLATNYHAVPLRLDFGQDFVLPRSDYDVVINNAGINVSDVMTHEVSTCDWERTIRINLTAPFIIVRQCLPAMVQNRWGRIINISSIYGLRAVEGNFPYTVSKHGLSGFTKTIAKEYAGHGITCNEICPGPIDSDMMREIAERSIMASGGSLSSYFREVQDEIPIKRLIMPSEIAALALFLASHEASGLTGASIPLDGGMVA